MQIEAEDQVGYRPRAVVAQSQLTSISDISEKDRVEIARKKEEAINRLQQKKLEAELTSAFLDEPGGVWTPGAPLTLAKTAAEGSRSALVSSRKRLRVYPTVRFLFHPRPQQGRGQLGFRLLKPRHVALHLIRSLTQRKGLLQP